MSPTTIRDRALATAVVLAKFDATVIFFALCGLIVSLFFSLNFEFGNDGVLEFKKAQLYRSDIISWPPVEPISTISNLCYVLVSIPILLASPTPEAGAIAAMLATMGWTSFYYHNRGSVSSTSAHFVDITAIKSGAFFFAALGLLELFFELISTFVKARRTTVLPFSCCGKARKNPTEIANCLLSFRTTISTAASLVAAFVGFVLATRLKLFEVVIPCFVLAGCSASLRVVLTLLDYEAGESAKEEEEKSPLAPPERPERSVQCVKGTATVFIFVIATNVVLLYAIGMGWLLNGLGETFRGEHDRAGKDDSWRSDFSHALWHVLSAVFLSTTAGRIVLPCQAMGRIDRFVVIAVMVKHFFVMALVLVVFLLCKGDPPYNTLTTLMALTLSLSSLYILLHVALAIAHRRNFPSSWTNKKFLCGRRRDALPGGVK